LEIVQAVEVNAPLQLSIQLKDGIEDYSEIPELLISTGIRLLAIHEDEINLETAFMTLTRGITS